MACVKGLRDDLRRGDVLLCRCSGHGLGQPSPRTPSQPRLAATVMLVRETCRSSDLEEAVPIIESFMIVRASSMPSAPGAMAFPGGGVNGDDRVENQVWAGPSPSEWASVMRCSEEEARCVVACAARELFEECGVLLAETPDGMVGESEKALLEEGQRDVASKRTPFGRFLANSGLRLRTDLLTVKSRWITPPTERRRYDTFFFAASLPPGQEPSGACMEFASSGWFKPMDVLSMKDGGRARLIPATEANVSLLSRAESVDALLREHRSEVFMLELDFDGEREAVFQCIVR